MYENSIPITTFNTLKGHYELLVMPFELKNAPQIFQRNIDKIFSKYSDFIHVYLDAILIYCNNKTNHKTHLDIFVSLCEENDIVLFEKESGNKKEKNGILNNDYKQKWYPITTSYLGKINKFLTELIMKELLQKFLEYLNYTLDFIKDLAKEKYKYLKKL